MSDTISISTKYTHHPVMNLVTAVICCNCMISALTIAIACQVMSLRQQVMAFAAWCDRWDDDCDRFLSDAPAAINDSRLRFDQLRQLYRQQLQLIDRVQSLRLLFGVARSVVANRRRFRI
jgi:hypothetical protein